MHYSRDAIQSPRLGTSACSRRRALLRRLRPRVVQQRPARDDGRERDQLEHALPAGREVLVEEQDAGDDRDRVRRQGRDAGRGERVAVLERALQLDRAGRVGRDQRHDREQPPVAEDGELRGHVAGGEEEPGSQAERDGVLQAQADDADERGGAEARAEPDDGGDRVRRVVVRIRADERDPEQHEPDDGEPDGPAVAPLEPRRMPARLDQRERGDPRRRDRLHERERREPERGDVDQPADRLAAEPDEPVAVADQHPRRGERAAAPRAAAAPRGPRRARACRPS